jgi:hypothetical protein
MSPLLPDVVPTFWDHVMISSLRVEISQENSYVVSKRRAPVAYWRGSTSQKNGDLNRGIPTQSLNAGVPRCHELSIRVLDPSEQSHILHRELQSRDSTDPHPLWGTDTVAKIQLQATKSFALICHNSLKPRNRIWPGLLYRRQQDILSEFQNIS